MKLKTNVFHITDSNSNDINLDRMDMSIFINGKLSQFKLSDLFSDMEFDDGEIYGNSLLRYYNVQDGKLVVEGSTVELKANNEPVMITTITRPVINDDTIISFEEIQKFSAWFGILNPDEVFTDLSNEEKQIFIDERLAKSKKKQAEDQVAADSETVRLAKEKEEADKKEINDSKEAEKKLKASIPAQRIHSKKQYLSDKQFYENLEPPFTEYINNNVHLFYGKGDVEQPYILIKRGADWFEEPADTAIADETDNSVTIEFTDDKTPKQIILDTSNGKTSVSDVENEK